MRRDPRLLADHRRVDVADLPALGRHPCDGLAQQLDAVGSRIALIGVRKMPADVAKRGRAENCVDHGMGEHVGVRESLEARHSGQLDAAEHERAGTARAVGVVADPDPPFRQPSVSCVRARPLNTAISSIPSARIASNATS